MNKLMKKLEDIMVAITFAESGEYDEAMKQSGTMPDVGEESGFNHTAFENAAK